MSSFYPLKVESIRSLTSNSVEIKFEILKELEEEFNFVPGQYITIKKDINGEDIRRSYSLCSSKEEGVCVGVKRVEGGKMSLFLTNNLEEGDMLEVMPPQGNFTLKGDNVVAICAGSGITPIISMMKAHKKAFTLIYGNQTKSSTMFYDELNYLDATIYHVLSKEKKDGFKHGRINSSILKDILEDKSLFDSYYICGPGEMIDSVSQFLIKEGVDKSKIYFERFIAVEKEIEKKEIDNINSNVLISVDGDDFEFQLSTNGISILDAAIEAGADAPFSCKGAVCCICKAKVIQGKAIMKQNYSLSEEEVEAGYILTCQAHPTSSDIVIDYDEI
tara:strand:- start:1501 stop:2496 length:996 start_codon:yes stop_codon:yes gene_type:complete